MGIEAEMRLIAGLVAVVTPIASAAASSAVMRYRQGAVERRVDDLEKRQTASELETDEIRGDLREVRTDVRWIREFMERRAR